MFMKTILLVFALLIFLIGCSSDPGQDNAGAKTFWMFIIILSVIVFMVDRDNKNRKIIKSQNNTPPALVTAKSLTADQISKNRKKAIIVIAALGIFIWAAIAIINNKPHEVISNEIAPLESFEQSDSLKPQFDTVAPATSTYTPSAPIEMPSTPADDEMHTKAYEIAKDFVEDNLKSPSSASFWRYDFNWSKLGEDEYFISSFVDAENSFGAKLKSKWWCKLKFNGGDWTDKNNWQLIDINISE